MKKRFVSFLLVMSFVCALCCGIAAATATRASDILSSYHVASDQGSGTGEFNVKYDVRADLSGTIGVESIEIYKSNGVYVTTIYGTTENGLMKAKAYRCSGTYTYTGSAGASYYAVVIISADSGSIYDSRQITTNIVKTLS